MSKKLFFSIFFLYSVPVSGMFKQYQLPNAKELPVVRYSNSPSWSVRDQLGLFKMEDLLYPSELDPAISVKVLPFQEWPGVCYNYAMMKTLKNYNINETFAIIGCQEWAQQLCFFKSVKKIKKNDLVVYFTDDERKDIHHFGLVFNENTATVKSKWGALKAIYTHPLFALPAAWGDVVSFFRLKKPYRTCGSYQEDFVQTIKNSMSTAHVLCLLYQKGLGLVSLAKKNDSAQTLIEIILLLEQIPSISVEGPSPQTLTPLMAAVSCNHVQVAELLLQYGANINAQDSSGNTALSLAQSMHHNKPMLKVLKQYCQG